MTVLKRKDIAKYKQKHQGKRCPLGGGSLTTPVLDHDHKTGYCREIVDRDLNQFLGKIETNYKRFVGHKKDAMSLENVLLLVSGYLRCDFSSNPLHPGWVDLQIRKFSRMNKKDQDKILKKHGLIPGKTSKERTKQLKVHMYREENQWK